MQRTFELDDDADHKPSWTQNRNAYALIVLVSAGHSYFHFQNNEEPMFISFFAGQISRFLKYYLLFVIYGSLLL